FLYFPAPASGALGDCGGNESGLFCPPNTESLTATNLSASGSGSSCVGFQIANAAGLVNSSSMVFSNIGGDSGTGSTAFFDWGPPFFFGRNVSVGFEG